MEINRSLFFLNFYPILCTRNVSMTRKKNTYRKEYISVDNYIANINNTVKREWETYIWRKWASRGSPLLDREIVIHFDRRFWSSQFQLHRMIQLQPRNTYEVCLADAGYLFPHTRELIYHYVLFFIFCFKNFHAQLRHKTVQSGDTSMI